MDAKNRLFLDVMPSLRLFPAIIAPQARQAFYFYL